MSIDIAQTSIESYHALTPAMLDKWQKVLLGCYRKYGPLSDRDLGGKIGKPASFVSARRNELVNDFHAVREAGTVFDEVTNRNVKVWTIVPERATWMFPMNQKKEMGN